ncbi:DUF393 domain-containing protein [Pedobacter gandavensis]|uniref:thiol-disulfide oxidoreductase DCC family protein n=1 Tax=Pedobacter gandavensis TaxID=2679963 RepID=UPI00292DEC5E|nr:DUF393 domain-containing protein [Pedobacter gandavensis]
MNENREHGLIFFDGICNLCNHTVQFIIKRDKYDYFRFAALQSDAAKEWLKTVNIELENTESLSRNELNGDPEQEQTVQYLNSEVLDQEKLNTIMLHEQGKTYYRSTAALRILRKLNGFWPLLYALIIIPPFIRDFFYRLISRNRYRIWGKQEHCMVPDADLVSKFL